MIEQLFSPRSIAFVGATEDRAKLGGRRYHSLVEEGFAGSIYPVHPSAKSLLGHKAYRSILDIPSPVDLAVIVVPTSATFDVVAECAARRVPAVMLITAGFGEVDATGRALEKEMAGMLTRAGCRMLGPNCAGLFNAKHNLNLCGAAIPRGSVALVSQSGNLLLDLDQHARERGGGFSRQVTVGNSADITSVELISDCLNDQDTHVVLAYLEGWIECDGRKLVDLYRMHTERKPLIVLKPGRSQIGAHAALTHTGSLAGNDRLVDAALKEANILRAETIEAAWDLSTALSEGLNVIHNEVVVISDGGGHATVLCDVLGSKEIQLAALGTNIVHALSKHLPSRAAVTNPVDFAGAVETDPSILPPILKTCFSSPNVGAIALAGHFGGYHQIGGAALEAREIEAARNVAALTKESPVPLVVHSIHANSRIKAHEILRKAGIPVLRSPEAVANLIASLYQASGRTPHHPVPQRISPSVRNDIRPLLRKTAHLLEPEARQLLSLYGLPVPEFVCVSTPKDCKAAVAAREPAALKLIINGLVHRSDVGAIALSVTKHDAEVAFHRLVATSDPTQTPEARVLVTKMIDHDMEVICGAIRDPQFGPAVLFGLGGVAAESMDDVALGLAPLSLSAAYNLTERIRGATILDSYRGRPALDRSAIADVLVRLGEIMDENPEISAIDLNPVMLSTDDALIADAYIVLDPNLLFQDPDCV